MDATAAGPPAAPLTTDVPPPPFVQSDPVGHLLDLLKGEGYTMESLMTTIQQRSQHRNSISMPPTALHVAGMSPAVSTNSTPARGRTEHVRPFQSIPRPSSNANPHNFRTPSHQMEPVLRHTEDRTREESLTRNRRVVLSVSGSANASQCMSMTAKPWMEFTHARSRHVWCPHGYPCVRNPIYFYKILSSLPAQIRVYATVSAW